MDFDEMYEADNVQVGQRVECHYCGRKFAPTSISKHSKICEKTHKKRPVFNSGKQRDVTSGSGIKAIPRAQTKPQANYRTQRQALGGSKPSWKQKHEEFINTVRTAREATAAIKEGRKPPPPVPSAPNPDYVQCPHCSRRFNESAAERHIRFCEEQAKRLANKKTTNPGVAAQAAARAAARLKYKPPSLKPSTGPRKSDGVESRSAPARVTRARMENSPAKQRVSKHNGNQYMSPSFANGVSKPPSGSGSGRKGNRNWDSSIEPSSNRPVARSKTGLKPASGSVTEENLYLSQYSPQSLQKAERPLVRKVAGKGEYRPSAKKGASRHMRPRHEWSSDSIYSDSDSDNEHYMPAAYKELNKNVRSPHSSNTKYKSPTQAGKIKVHQPKDFPTYTRRSPALRSPVANGDTYDWLSSNQEPKSRKPINGVYGVNTTPSPSNSSRFCHECGARYPVPNAKFCCDCGVRRIVLT